MPTKAGGTFFAEMQGAAVMKHALLGRYIRLFANKVGKLSPGHKVVYVDGYAGPGLYADGAPGSPIVAATVASLIQDVRDLQCYFIEKDPAHVSALESHLSTALPGAQVVQGEMETYIDGLLNVSRGRPMLAFIDPFGLGLSYDAITKLAARKEPTDLIINVSLAGVRRNAGHLSSTKTYAAKDTLVANLDRALGGTWWHEEWLNQRDAEAICDQFCVRAANLRSRTIWTPVRDRWDGPTAYFLLLITKHRDGLWAFAEFMSYAHDALRAADPKALSEDEMLIPFAHDWQLQIEQNIVALLAKQTHFTIGDNLTEVFGSTLGFARSMHVRAAIKSLHAKGGTSTNGVGDVQKMVVRR